MKCLADLTGGLLSQGLGELTDPNIDAMVKYDDPFDLIERGNAFASSSSHWSAADAYFQASISLEHRAGTLSNPPSNEIEQRRIVTLFRTQSLEYFFKARHSLLRALTLENEQDRQNSKRAANCESHLLLYWERIKQKKRDIIQATFHDYSWRGN